MNREFFNGHKLPIVFICFISNSPATIVTVDANGHVFTWVYSAEHVTPKQRFEPAGKFRVDLLYKKAVKTREERVFPIPGQKEITEVTKPVTVQATLQMIKAYCETTPLPAIGSRDVLFETVSMKAIDRYVNPKT